MLKTTDTTTHNDIINIVKSSDPSKDWITALDGKIPHTSIRYYKDDVNLRFEVNQNEEAYYHNKDFQEEWANQHADRKAHSYFVRLYYNATLIEQFTLIYVDGGRASLPMPKSREDLTVDPLDYKVAQIHDGLNTLDDYMGRSNLEISKES